MQFPQLLLIIKTMSKLHCIKCYCRNINNTVTPFFNLLIKCLLWGYHFYEETHCCWFSISLWAIRMWKSGLMPPVITKKWTERKSFRIQLEYIINKPWHNNGRNLPTFKKKLFAIIRCQFSTRVILKKSIFKRKILGTVWNFCAYSFKITIFDIQ